MTEKLVFNPVLNFLSRSLTEGVKFDQIVKSAVNYFEHDTIIQAKKTLHSELDIQSRMVSYAKDEDNITDMCKSLVSAAKQNVPIPKFVIFSPCEVPAIGEAVHATVVSKVNELSRKLDGFMLNTSRSTVTLPDKSQSSQTAPPRPLYSVILKDPPTDLKCPSERKAFIDKLCPCPDGDITELRRSNTEWKLVVRSKQTASQIVDAAKRAKPSLNISLKEPAFLAAIKRVPEDLDEQSLKQLIPKCNKTLQCGKSRTFKVYFPTRNDLDTFLKVSVKIGYERLPVEEFVFLPRRCFNCHAIGHLAADCKNGSLCSKCGSADHKSTSDTPCQKAAFCVGCKKQGHTCYSVKCPKNRKPSN